MPYLPDVFVRINKSGIDFNINIERNTGRQAGEKRNAMKYDVCRQIAAKVTIPRIIVYLSL
jgi:hypothetical protein